MARFSLTLSLALFVGASLVAQGYGNHARVVLPTGPTNMLVDWSQVTAVPDAQSNAFVAIMPISAVSTWAFWEPDEVMDLSYGPGGWQQLSLNAYEWAYLSPDACAHQPAPGNAAPISLLTSDYDSGSYSGVPGFSLFPGALFFVGNAPQIVGGLMNMSSFSLERWQLRTRGFFSSDAWNACAPNGTITPNFTGVIGVRFTVN